MIVPPGFVDVDGSLFIGGTLYLEVYEDGIYFPILDESTARVFDWGLGLPLHPNLQRQSGVENELPEVSLVDQVLQMPP